MSVSAWLETVKAGDPVIVNRGVMGGSTVTTVDRVTATQIIVRNGKAETRFRRHDGDEVGNRDAWHRGAWLQEATPERVEAIRKVMLRSHVFHAIRSLDIRRTSDETIEALARVLGVEMPE